MDYNKKYEQLNSFVKQHEKDSEKYTEKFNTEMTSISEQIFHKVGCVRLKEFSEQINSDPDINNANMEVIINKHSNECDVSITWNTEINKRK